MAKNGFVKPIQESRQGASINIENSMFRGFRFIQVDYWIVSLNLVLIYFMDSITLTSLLVLVLICTKAPFLSSLAAFHSVFHIYRGNALQPWPVHSTLLL